MPLNSSPWHVLCVGDVMVDVVVRLPGPLVVGSDAPAPIELRGGGSAANTASWLTALGTPTTLLARVGPESDPLRMVAIGDLPRAVTQALTANSAPTGRCLVLVGPDGERTMVPDAGANARLVAADLDADHFRRSRHLHLSGYVLLGPARQAGLAALSRARAAGMTISVDASSVAPLSAIGADGFLQLVGSEVLLFANLPEACVLTGISSEAADTDPIAVAHLLAQRVGCAIVKLGREGAVWADAERSERVSTAAIAPVDTTGAGDAFAAGFLYAMGRTAPIAEALRSACSAATRACATVGGRAPS